MRYERRAKSGNDDMTLVQDVKTAALGVALIAGLFAMASLALADDHAASQNETRPPHISGAAPGTPALVNKTDAAAIPPQSNCFTMGSDDAPAEGQELVIPKQVVCPFVRLPSPKK